MTGMASLFLSFHVTMLLQKDSLKACEEQERFGPTGEKTECLAEYVLAKSTSIFKNSPFNEVRSSIENWTEK